MRCPSGGEGGTPRLEMAAIKMRGQEGRTLFPHHPSDSVICADKFIAMSPSLNERQLPCQVLIV